VNFVREIIFKNFGWKLLSVALAFAIWLTVKTTSAEQGQTERVFLSLPLQIVSGTADVRTFQMEPATVTVTLKGRPEVINRLAEREIRALVDVTSADVTQNFRRHVDVAVPSGITVVHVEPAEVQITPPKPKGVINIVK
jgi:hypothetical protein